jgi:hypothetical protein
MMSLTVIWCYGDCPNRDVYDVCFRCVILTSSLGLKESGDPHVTFVQRIFQMAVEKFEKDVDQKGKTPQFQYQWATCLSTAGREMHSLNCLLQVGSVPTFEPCPQISLVR